MKRLLAGLFLLASTIVASAQCTGNVPAGRVCGSSATTLAPASWVVPDGVRSFDTYALAQTATVGATTQVIMLENYRAGAKGGGGKWTKQASANAVALANITTADGFHFHYTPEGDVEVQSLGAPYDGLSNAKTHFDAAISFAVGRRIHVPVGIYRFDAPLAATTNMVHMICDGHGQSTSPGVTNTAQSSTLRINYNGAALLPVDNGGINTVEGCLFQSAAAQRPQTSGGAFSFTSSTAGLGIGVTLRGNAFDHLYDAVVFNKPGGVTVDGNIFNAHYRSALRYTTSGGLEGGIGTVENNIFTAYLNNPTNIIYSEIGYGKIRYNYMVGASIGIHLNILAGYSAGSVEITNNQIEEQITHGVLFQAGSAGSTATMAKVNDNQFSNLAVVASFVAHVMFANFDGATVWPETVQVERNIYRSVLGAAGRYIYAQSGRNVSIIGNKIKHFGSASTIGIEVNGAELLAPVTVHSNTYDGVLVKEVLGVAVNQFNVRSLGYYNLNINNSDTLATANRTLSFHTFDADRAIALAGNLTLAGGLSLPAVVQGDLWYGSAAATVLALAKDTNATRYLSNQGTTNNPSWSQVNLTNGVTNTLPPGNGGTGVANSANLTVSTATSVGLGQYQGTNTNDNATAGNIGEVVESSVALGSAVPLTSTVPANVTSVSIAAGDWDCWYNILFDTSGTTNVVFYIGTVNTISATLPTPPNGGAYSLFNYPGGVPGYSSDVVGRRRYLVSGTTTVFLIVDSQFTVSTVSAYGHLGCRRTR